MRYGRSRPRPATFIRPVPTAAPATGSQIKVWTGSAWALKPVKRWNGSAWVPATVKRWTGSSWTTL